MAQGVRRRTVLKLTGAAGAALSLREAGRAARAPSGASRRLVLVYTPWGTVPDAYWPAAGTDVTASRILAPLGAHRAALTLVEGFDAPKGALAARWLSAMTAFTGRDPFDEAPRAVAPGQIDGPSLDHAVAGASGWTHPVLRLATGVRTDVFLHDVCFGDDGRAFRPGQVGGDGAGLDDARAGEAARLVTAALEADDARVVVWRMASAADARVAGLDVAGALAARDTLDARETLVAAQRFFAAQVASLADRLGATRRDGRSLLDSTVILWTSGAGSLAGGAPLPVAILGTADGALPTRGRVRVPAAARGRYGDLLASLGRAVTGGALPGFGEERHAGAPLFEPLT